MLTRNAHEDVEEDRRAKDKGKMKKNIEESSPKGMRKSTSSGTFSKKVNLECARHFFSPNAFQYEI